ncbi:MAG: hypothetical protein ACLT0Y_04985 [Christensenellales bacterium]
MQRAMDETRAAVKSIMYNKEHNITPHSVEEHTQRIGNFQKHRRAEKTA